MQKRQTGRRGELIAAAALIDAGYEIVDRNWRCAQGELDLIAREGNELVFVEVRSRTEGRAQRNGEGINAALESITPVKSARLVELAQAYLTMNDMEHVPFRIDVVAVSFTSGQPTVQPTVEIIQNAVGW